MNIRLLVLSLLIIGCCSDTLYGAQINARKKNSIQHRQAQQIKAAKELKKHPQEKEQLADKGGIEAASNESNEFCIDLLLPLIAGGTCGAIIFMATVGHGCCGEYGC